jgi:hypothetical protein
VLRKKPPEAVELFKRGCAAVSLPRSTFLLSRAVETVRSTAVETNEIICDEHGLEYER